MVFIRQLNMTENSKKYIDLLIILIDNVLIKKGECIVSLGKVFRMTIGANALLLLTVLFLPALLITNDISIIQSAIDYINKD